MSSANVELVRSVVSAWERGDYDRLGWEHPDVELVIVDGPSPARWQGLEAVRKGWGDFLSAWEGFHAETEEVRAIDAERVLQLGRFHGRGKTSGVELASFAAENATVFTVRENSIARIALYFDRERALADLAG